MNKNNELYISILDMIKDSYGTKKEDIILGAKMMLNTLKKELVSNDNISLEYKMILEKIIKEFS